MAKFMNAELIAIRDNLTCNHCKSIFKGSDSQAWKVKYEQKKVYCSDVCRSSAMQALFRKDIPVRGPCPTCNKTFLSRSTKIFCSMTCYSKSPQFKEHYKRIAKKGRISQITKNAERPLKPGEVRVGKKIMHELSCIECQNTIICSTSSKNRGRRFCNSICYRAYMSKLYDQWVANPESLALPQCYDEFLDGEKLRCLVKDCNWTGVQLSTHMNQKHGARAADFKRSAGFNLSTGVIAKPLAKRFSERGLTGVAMDEVRNKSRKTSTEGSYLGSQIRAYRSLESIEHAIKGRASTQRECPMRICDGCKKQFQQSTPYGRAKFCTRECRSEHYSRVNKKPFRVRLRNADGTWMAD